MPNILIITEDIVKIQTLTGLLGQLYSFIYISWLRLRLKLIICFSPEAQVLTSDAFNNIQKNIFYYGQELANLNYAANRQFYWKITNKILDALNRKELTELFAVKLASYLTYNYLVYADLYQKIFDKINPKKVIILGSSPHELIAEFIAREKGICVVKISLLQLSWLNQTLNHFFINREYKTKIERFLTQSQHPLPEISTIKKSTLLSLDFYRHLKTLAPIYSNLQKKHSPLLVTDIPNLESSLSNLNLKNARAVYLAGFLGKRQILNVLSQKSIKLPVSEAHRDTLQDFLFNLSLKTAKPLISNSLILAKLYQLASQKLFKTLKPSGVVIVSDARLIELSLAQQAKKNHTPSIMVSPNAILDATQLNPYTSTDKIAVVGSYIQDQLINIGVPSKKIHIVGDARIENYDFLKKHLSRETIYQKLQIKDLSKKIVLLISFRSNWYIPKPEKEMFIKMASQAVAANPDTILVIKPHPTEKRYRIIEELNQWGIKNVIVSDNNQLELMELLHAANVVVQTWSMTIFEAIMMRRPVIVINPQSKNYGSFNPIIKTGGAIEVKNQQDLNHWVKVLVNPNDWLAQNQLSKATKSCEEFIKSPDGKTAEQITSLLFSKGRKKT